jgi:hypothetical protein
MNIIIYAPILKPFRLPGICVKPERGHCVTRPTTEIVARR